MIIHIPCLINVSGKGRKLGQRTRLLRGSEEHREHGELVSGEWSGPVGTAELTAQVQTVYLGNAALAPVFSVTSLGQVY